MMELNETNGRPSRAERNECGWHDEEEDKDLEGLPHISPTWYNDSKTSNGNTELKELDDCDEEEFVDCQSEPQYMKAQKADVLTEPIDCNKEAFKQPRMVLRPHVTVVEQGPLISGRLDVQLESFFSPCSCAALCSARIGESVLGGGSILPARGDQNRSRGHD
jgi:hypothetical protein